MTVVVAVPAITALAFAGLRIQAELAEAGDLNRIVGQVDASMLITEVVHQLQGERGVTAAAVADGSIASSEAVQDQVKQTDAAISELREKVGGLEIEDRSSKDRYNYAFKQLGQLTPLRDLAASSTYPDLAVLNAYNGLIDPLVQLGREITAAGDATGQAPSRLSAAVQSIGQAKERASQLDSLLMVSAVRNSFRSANVQSQAAAASAGFDASIADFVATASPDERQEFTDGYSGADVDRRKGFAQSALLGSDPTAPLDLDLAQLQDTSTAANDKLRGVETNLITSLRTQASGLASAATTTAWQVALIVAGAMIVALVLMLAMAQTLVNPLRKLRRGALRVANTTLPKTIERILKDANPVEAAKNAVAPMPVDTSEEVGQVARAFDVVHERAVRLATEQAVLRDHVNDMFVNLSRRSQALVERQLSELDKLEKNERDPDQLAQFFVLDHLAARMRRNSENLLILSGVGVARRSSHPVSINEVVGAAQSEIESYSRVVLKPGPDTVVKGRVVNDVVHLLAELLDNATKFSASDTEVTVSSTHVRTGELAVQISDKGLGLSDEELTDINRRLIDPPPFDLAVSRRMGLYVVARLAKRHDIRVRLHGDFNSGTSAVVVLPKALTGGGSVTGPATPVPAVVTDPGTRKAVNPGSQPSMPPVSQPSMPPGSRPSMPGSQPSMPGSRPSMRPVSRPSTPAAGPPTGSQPVARPGSSPPSPPSPPPSPPDGTGPVTAPTSPVTGPLHRPHVGSRSAWFQRTIPATALPGHGHGGNSAGNGGGNAGGNTGDNGQPGGTAKGAKGKGKGKPSDPKPADAKAADPKAPAPKTPAANVAAPSAADPKAVPPSALNWSTAGEDGWSAVRRKLGETAQQAKLGDPLPRRKPGSRLVPGSAGAPRTTTNGNSDDAEAPTTSVTRPNAAERARDRLNGFQEGLSRARDEQRGARGEPPPREER
jgi:signal transduction histidine kinase